jgi:hypothetical protein
MRPPGGCRNGPRSLIAVFVLEGFALAFHPLIRFGNCFLNCTTPMNSSPYLGRLNFGPLARTGERKKSSHSEVVTY